MCGVLIFVEKVLIVKADKLCYIRIESVKGTDIVPGCVLIVFIQVGISFDYRAEHISQSAKSGSILSLFTLCFHEDIEG